MQTSTTRHLMARILIASLAFALLVTSCATDDGPPASSTSAAVSGKLHSTPVVDDGVFVAEISLTEFAITGTLTVPAGPVVLSVTNFGSAEHNLQFNDGPITPMLGTNRSAVLDLGTLRPGTYPMTCEISGH